jgi:hypothetical protein
MEFTCIRWSCFSIAVRSHVYMFHLYLKALRNFSLKSLQTMGMSELHSFYIRKDGGLGVLNSGLLKYATVTMEV